MMDQRIYSAEYIPVLREPIKYLLSISPSKEMETKQGKEKFIY